jgi:NADH-quinone oxidoreductase subunit B
MKQGIYLSTVGKVLNWARANSLWFIQTGNGCCADEVMEAMGARYDLERFGCQPQVDPRQADLLIISGMVTKKAAEHLRALYDAMPAPKYVLAIGSCANCGGAFAPPYSYSVVPGADKIVPVDVFVPGCPPRPEAIMNGLITLQEKINEHQRASAQA